MATCQEYQPVHTGDCPLDSSFWAGGPHSSSDHCPGLRALWLPLLSSHRLVHSQVPTIHQIKGLYSERGASGRAGASAKLQASAPRLPTLDRGPSPAQDPGPPAGSSTRLVHSFHTSITYLLYATVSSLVALLSLELCILGHAFLSHLLRWSWIGSFHPRWCHLPGPQFRGPLWPVARLGIYFVLGTAARDLCDPIDPPKPSKVGLSCRHPSLAESEAQKDRVTCPRSHSW